MAGKGLTHTRYAPVHRCSKRLTEEGLAYSVAVQRGGGEEAAGVGRGRECRASSALVAPRVNTLRARRARAATHLVRVRARIRPRIRERVRARARVRAKAGTRVRVSRSLPLEAVLDTLPLRPEVTHGGGAHLGRVRATARVRVRVR